MNKTTLLPLLLAGLVGGLVATALDALVADPVAGPPAVAASPAAARTAAPAEERPSSAPLLPADWQPRLEALEAEVASLAAELELARATTRSAVPEEPVAAPPELEALLAEVGASGGDIGQYVLDLIDRDAERRAEEREDEELERRRVMAGERARRIAEEVGLDDYERDQVAEVLLGEMSRMREARDRMFSGDGGGIRDAFREVRAWKDAELEARLGPDLAQRVDEADDRGRWGGRGPGERGDRTPGDGPPPDGRRGPGF